jgi:multimeric flavodoxin WrbA
MAEPERMLPKRLLVVSHSASGNTEAMTGAVLAGARSDEVDGIEVVALDALEATDADVRACDGLLLGTPTNFGYMSGALKYFFDRIYDPCLEHTRGLPYALFVKGRSDASGAVRSVQRIVTGLQWKEAQPPLVVEGDLGDDDLERCRELGMTMAAGVEMGLF